MPCDLKRIVYLAIDEKLKEPLIKYLQGNPEACEEIMKLTDEQLIQEMQKYVQGAQAQQQNAQGAAPVPPVQPGPQGQPPMPPTKERMSIYGTPIKKGRLLDPMSTIAGTDGPPGAPRGYARGGIAALNGQPVQRYGLGGSIKKLFGGSSGMAGMILGAALGPSFGFGGASLGAGKTKGSSKFMDFFKNNGQLLTGIAMLAGMGEKPKRPTMNSGSSEVSQYYAAVNQAVAEGKDPATIRRPTSMTQTPTSQLYSWAQPKGYAEGGAVDDIPALLTEGEFVMTKKAVDNAGGASKMYELMDSLEKRYG